MASLLKNLASPFDSSKSYKFGDRFLFGGYMYQVLEPFSGELDMTKVSEITIADLVKGGYPPCDNFAGVSLEASAVTTDGSNTYFNVPKPGYYNEDSKIFAENSNLREYSGWWQCVGGRNYIYNPFDTPWNFVSIAVEKFKELTVINKVVTQAAQYATWRIYADGEFIDSVTTTEVSKIFDVTNYSEVRLVGLFAGNLSDGADVTWILN